MCMRILQSWAESLTILKPKNFKLFLLVTLKSIVETYKILFTKFWPVSSALLLAMYCLLYVHDTIANRAVISLYTIFFGFFSILFLFLIFLMVRPSISQKNWHYVLRYWQHFLFFFVTCVMITLIFMLTKKVPFFNFLLLVGYYGCQASPLFVIVTGFLLDSDGSEKSMIYSCWRGLKFCLFNYPFCLFGFLFFYYSFYVLSSFGVWYVSILLWPLPVCFFINFYVKRLHEQFDVYFEQKGSQ